MNIKKSLRKIKPLMILKDFILKKFYELDKLFFFIMSKTLFTTKIYYFFFNRKFDREIFSVAKGRIKFLQNELNMNTLVRNTHRLEKGLTMRNRKKEFGLNYINDTVESFLFNYKINNNDNQVIWSYQVLTKYFEVVKSEKLNTIKKKFKSLELKEYSQKMLPYKRKENQNVNISYDEFFQLSKVRKSVRWFSNKKVEIEKIVKAIDVAKLSPSACNRQPYEFQIISNKQKINEIGSIPMGTSGYYQNIPVLIAVIGKLSSYFHERDRHLIYIDGGLACMTLMLSLETLGLSSCPINWPDVDRLERKMKSKLNLENDDRPIMFIAVGYADPDGGIPFSQKKSSQELVKKI